MKRTMTLLLLAVVLTAVSCMSPIALAAEVCYPTAVEQSEDGGEIRKVYRSEEHTSELQSLYS